MRIRRLLMNLFRAGTIRVDADPVGVQTFRVSTCQLESLRTRSLVVNTRRANSPSVNPLRTSPAPAGATLHVDPLHTHPLRSGWLSRALLVSFILCVLIIRPSSIFSQEEAPHPELNWRTIETEHFFVHYHDGAERTARVVSKIAEDIFPSVTAFYDHKPDQKVSFIIKDYDDISNGAAYFYDNKIEIYAPSMDFELRGTHNWLRNVITHEYTHIVQIQTSMKFGRTVPAIYFQWLGYEAERRLDVLYGYPNIVVSYPVSGFVVPAWFAEGVAQYNRADLRYDYWDTHRDMILRSYALDNNMLSWEQMGVFGKTSLGNESSYNAGFAFVSYIARRYGEEKLVEVSRHLSSFSTMTIDAAIEKAVGKNGRDVYDEWRSLLKKEYAERVVPVRTALREGKPFVTDSAANVVDPGQIQTIESMLLPRQRTGSIGQLSGAAGELSGSTGQFPVADGQLSGPAGQLGATDQRSDATVGFANLYPVFSPDGTKLAFTSAKGGDYFGLSSLYVYDSVKKTETLVQPGVRTAPAWSPDGTKLYYGRQTRDNPHWSLQFDIYEYDLQNEEERRLTTGRRAFSPTVSPDGKQVAFVSNRDGSTNLAVVNLDGTGYREITLYASGEQVYNPCWSPSGDRIVFDYSVRDGRDIAWVRPDGADLEFLVTGDDDSRAARFSHDGSALYFSSDRTGIFNIYRMDVAARRTDQITNVLGGAFYPTVNSAGALAYAAYTSGGYKIHYLEQPAVLAGGNHNYIRTLHDGTGAPGKPPVLASRSTAVPEFDWDALRGYDDASLSPLESRPYKSIFTSLSVVPVIRIDNYNPKATGLEVIKAGAYVFSSDVLDKTGIFAGATLNALLERDLFLQFIYRGRIPLLYEIGLEPVATVEAYNLTRKTESVINLPASTIPVDVEYNLTEFDFSLRQPLFSQFVDAEFRYAHSRYTSIIGSFINPETDPPSLVGSSSDLYLIANNLSLALDVNAILPSRTQDINPIGRKIRLRANRELNKFNGDGEYEVTSTGLQPLYKDVNFTRIEFQWKEYLPFFFRNHTVGLYVRGGSILGPTVDEFFDFYAGGLVGMKGYPYYSLGGNEMAMVGVNYRFPILQNIDIRLFQLYFDKLYASVYADAGNAWSDYGIRAADMRRDIGIELRLEAFSYYSYPTRFFLSASYGLDTFDRYVQSQNQMVTYGHEWMIYFGILFGFDID